MTASNRRRSPARTTTSAASPDACGPNASGMDLEPSRLRPREAVRMMTTKNQPPPELRQMADAIVARRRFVLSSHSRPDGDSIGSQLAMAYALRALGKDVHVVN